MEKAETAEIHFFPSSPFPSPLVTVGIMHSLLPEVCGLLARFDGSRLRSPRVVGGAGLVLYRNGSDRTGS